MKQEEGGAGPRTLRNHSEWIRGKPGGEGVEVAGRRKGKEMEPEPQREVTPRLPSPTPAPGVSATYCLHAHDGLLHLGDIRDMVLVGLELLLLDPFIDADYQLPGDVGAVIHTCGWTWTWRGKGVSGAWSQRREAPYLTAAPEGWPGCCLVPVPNLQWLAPRSL